MTAAPTTTATAGDTFYDHGSLWRPIVKKLRRSSITDDLKAVESTLLLRNLLGAHSNDFAESVAGQEADQFGRAVLALWDDVFCGACGRWVERKGDGMLSCRCGTMTIIY